MTGAARTTIGKLTQGGPKKRKPISRGRTSHLTPEVSKKICDAVRAGNYVSVAARYCGVAEVTLHDWIQRGRGEHPTRSASQIFVDFVRDLDVAEAGAEVAAVLHWRAAMPKDWHSSEKWLKVRQPERWAEKSPEQMATGAFAGVQVNIGVGGGSTSTNGMPVGIQVPLSALLEENPDLIEGTMQFLDQLLPVNVNTDEDAAIDVSAPETSEPSPIYATPGTFRVDSDVFDAEPGSWSQIDDNGA